MQADIVFIILQYTANKERRITCKAIRRSKKLRAEKITPLQLLLPEQPEQLFQYSSGTRLSL